MVILIVKGLGKLLSYYVLPKKENTGYKGKSINKYKNT